MFSWTANLARKLSSHSSLSSLSEDLCPCEPKKSLLVEVNPTTEHYCREPRETRQAPKEALVLHGQGKRSDGHACLSDQHAVEEMPAAIPMLLRQDTAATNLHLVEFGRLLVLTGFGFITADHVAVLGNLEFVAQVLHEFLRLCRALEQSTHGLANILLKLTFAGFPASPCAIQAKRGLVKVNSQIRLLL